MLQLPKETIKHSELLEFSIDSYGSNRVLAIGLLRFSKAVNATILEIDDLFSAIQLALEIQGETPDRVKCDSCRKYRKCLIHQKQDFTVWREMTQNGNNIIC